MNDLEFKAYHYARLKIELALVMGWTDILNPKLEEMEKKFREQYIEKHGPKNRKD